MKSSLYIRRAVSRLALGAMVAIAVGSAGCTRRELCYDHSHWTDLKIEFDWNRAPQAQPRTMVVYLFPRNGGDPRRYEIADPVQGGTVRVPADCYDAVAFNGDTETLTENGSDFSSFFVSTRESELLTPQEIHTLGTPPRPDGTDSQPVRVAPDPVWSDRAEAFEVTPSGKPQSLRFTPAEATVVYTVNVVNAENLSSDFTVSGAITGVAESHSPAAGTAAGGEVTVPFAMEMTSARSLSGSVVLFGHCPDGTDSRSHILTLYTSTKKFYNFDITDKLHGATDPTHVTITISGIRFPEPGEAGMNPDVSDWREEVDIDISMN